MNMGVKISAKHRTSVSSKKSSVSKFQNKCVIFMKYSALSAIDFETYLC